MKKIVMVSTVLMAGTLMVNGQTVEEKKKRFRQELSHVPAAELPAKAAEIVKKTPANERSEAAVIAVEVVAEKHPTAAGPAAAAISRVAKETQAGAVGAATRKEGKGNGGGQNGGNGNGNGNSGPGNGNGNANGGVGHGVNKPGKPIHPHPVKDTLPNGKPRHFPKEKPQPYNKPKQH
jgi:hypothetical protein